MNGGADKMVRMRDIAERCGVHRSTVSLALRGDKRLTPETIDRITSVAKEMGYDPIRHEAARRLAASKYHDITEVNKSIGLFFVQWGFTKSRYFIGLFEGIADAMSVVDFDLHTSDSWRAAKTNILPAVYRRGDIDGCLTVHQQPEWTNVLGVLRSEPNFGDRPIVGLVSHIDGCSAVYGDHYQAGQIAAEHLLDLGHRNILHFFLSPPEGVGAHSVRLRAIHDMFRSRGLAPEGHLRVQEWKSGQLEASLKWLISVLRHRREVTAMITRDDAQAAQVHGALCRAGVRVPEDISLIGCDDTEIITDDRANNILTTVRFPLAEIGRQGTALLLRRIQGEETEDRDIVLPVELVVRSSTAPPKNRAK